MQLIPLIHSLEGKRWISRRKGKSVPRDGRQHQTGPLVESADGECCVAVNVPHPAQSLLVSFCRGFTTTMYTCILKRSGEITGGQTRLKVALKVATLHWLYCLFDPCCPFLLVAESSCSCNHTQASYCNHSYLQSDARDRTCFRNLINLSASEYFSPLRSWSQVYCLTAIKKKSFPNTSAPASRVKNSSGQRYSLTKTKNE